jgi:hypothetical protein
MKKYLLLISGLALFLFFSCKEDTAEPKTKTQLLTQGSWKFSAATANGGDASSYLQACQKDNIYTFVAAGTGTMDEGPSKCNAADPQTSTFNWNWATNETILHINTPLFSGSGNDFTLVSLTETELKVSFTYTPPIGPSIIIVATFIH